MIATVISEVTQKGSDQDFRDQDLANARLNPASTRVVLHLSVIYTLYIHLNERFQCRRKKFEK